MPLAVVVIAFVDKPSSEVLPLDENAATTEVPAADVPASGRMPDAAHGGSPSPSDRIAFAYDAVNTVLSLGLDRIWRQALVEDCLDLHPGDHVLDIATGTGDVALLAAVKFRSLQPLVLNESITGLDLSQEMLRRSAMKADALGLRRAMRLVQGRAEDMNSVRDLGSNGEFEATSEGIASQSVDKVSLAFGLRELQDRGAALRELRRALRKTPQSRVCVLDATLPAASSDLWRATCGRLEQARSTVSRFLTDLGSDTGWMTHLGPDIEETCLQLFRSLLSYPQPTALAAEFASAGLQVNRLTRFALGAVTLYEATPRTVPPSAGMTG